MSDKLYQTFAFIGFILVLTPLPWHLQAWNAGTCLFMFWTAVGCLIHFIDSIVWAGNIELHSAPWCDISSKLIVGLSVALPCASLCINRRLYAIARVSQAHISQAEKHRAVYIDLAIGIGFPVVVMALHYIVQGHRFDVFENIGCWPSTFNTPPAYPLVWMWPVVIGLISMTYSVLSLRAFLRRRQEFNQFLATNQSMNVSRYFRLMALATAEICMTTPFSIYFIYLNVTTVEISPWVSWSDTKWHFSRIDYVQAFFVDNQPYLKLNFKLNLWLFPACAILFFAFFGVAEEARKNYTKYFCYVLKLFGVSSPPPYNFRSQISKAKVIQPSHHTRNVDETSMQSSKWNNFSSKTPDSLDQSISLSNIRFKSTLDSLSRTSFTGATARGSMDSSSISMHSPNSTYATLFEKDDGQHRNTIIAVDEPESQTHDCISLPNLQPDCTATFPSDTPRETLHPTYVVDEHSTLGVSP